MRFGRVTVAPSKHHARSTIDGLTYKDHATPLERSSRIFSFLCVNKHKDNPALYGTLTWEH